MSWDKAEVPIQQRGFCASNWQNLDFSVECFAQHVQSQGEFCSISRSCETLKLLRGCRWDWPGKCLAWQALRRIRRCNPDFVFVVGITQLASYLLQSNIASRLAVWENTNADSGNKFVSPRAVQSLSRARAVLSPSKTIDRAIRQTYAYQGRLLRLPFWIEDQAKPPSPPPSKFLADFIFLGRRDKDKGIEELIRATATVAESFPSVRVLIAGMGDETPFAKLVSELNVEKNVVFQYFESRNETLKTLASSRSLVLPSYHEGYPLVLLEAAQYGVPFIATSVGSIPEIFGNSSGAKLVPAKDHLALATAMEQMLSESPESYADRRTIVQQMFQQLSSANTVESNLQKVLLSLEQLNQNLQ